jgi:polysaccharide export outer membrane protein
MWLLTLLVAGMGCRTADYRASSLPEVLRVPPAPKTTVLNLERMGGADGGTSEIGAGDLLDITIVSGSETEQITPIPARVAEDGTVMVPLIGPVGVGGLEPFAAEQRIAAAAVERGIYRQPYVTLRVKEQSVNRVTVLGAVEKPGLVALPRGSCNLAGALAAAGGLSDEAGTEIQILHRGPASLVADGAPGAAERGVDGVRLASRPDAITPIFDPQAADYSSARQPVAEMTRINLAEAGPAAREERGLQDGDMVMVTPGQKRFVHVTGLVREPDQFELLPDKDIRVLDAIAMAGGASSPLADKVYVIRQLPDMPRPAVIQVSMAGAKRNGEENLRLATGDLVSVEPTLSTMTLDTISQFFRVGLGLSGSIPAF